jgi:hypothetical protein
MGFIDKRLRSLPAITVADRQLKRYHIDQPSRPLDEGVIRAAYAVLPKAVPPAEVDAVSGWIVLHRGADDGAYMLVYTWVWDNVVEMHSYSAGQPLIGCPDTDPTNFVELVKPWIGCVWELAVLEHERSAWVQHVLSPDSPDLAGYLADTHADGPIGR